jgi:hypothetical protein
MGWYSQRSLSAGLRCQQVLIQSSNHVHGFNAPLLNVRAHAGAARSLEAAVYLELVGHVEQAE